MVLTPWCGPDLSQATQSPNQSRQGSSKAQPTSPLDREPVSQTCEGEDETYESTTLKWGHKCTRTKMSTPVCVSETRVIINCLEPTHGGATEQIQGSRHNHV